MRIDRRTIEGLAELAALDPDSVATDALAAELERIAGYCAILDELPDTPPAQDDPRRAPRRADRPRDAGIRDAALAQAARVVDDHFAVPPVPTAGIPAPDPRDADDA